MKNMRIAILTTFILMTTAVTATIAADDPLSGSWTGDWGPSERDRNQVTVELKWDGKTLTGNVNPGPNAVEVKNATFDPQSGAIHMEAEATSRRGTPIHYMIDGKVEGNTMTGTWSHDNRKGDFKITKQ